MNKPLIGIVGKPDNTDDLWSYIKVNSDIRQCLNKNNALAIGILPQDFKYQNTGDNDYTLNQDEINDLKEIINKVDGVILQGGVVGNSYEQEIVRICIDMDLPILGICYGFNNMIKALGGNMVDDTKSIHNQYGVNYAHDVQINENSKLYSIIGKNVIKVNSVHEKIALPNTINGYSIVATCPLDNSVEAIEIPNKRFVIGIKWHPELMNDDCMNNIFTDFINECRKNKG